VARAAALTARKVVNPAAPPTETGRALQLQGLGSAVKKIGWGRKEIVPHGVRFTTVHAVAVCSPQLVLGNLDPFARDLEVFDSGKERRNICSDPAEDDSPGGRATRAVEATPQDDFMIRHLQGVISHG
jgi:hypothetical protein